MPAFCLAWLAVLPQLSWISLNAINATQSVQNVTNNQVRYIANTGIAESVFGMPFGNAPRNIGRDAPLNHPNFLSVDPFVDDAGLRGAGTGFGDVNQTNSTFPGFNNATRRITFYGVFRFQPTVISLWPAREIWRAFFLVCRACSTA